MRGFSSVLSAAVAAVALATAAPAVAATTLNVDWSDGCGKSTCFDDRGVYSRTWSASEFSGPISIRQLLMQRVVLGALDGATFRISFELGGEELGSWGHYNMAGIGGDLLTFSGEGVVWNPADGDLVLILVIDPPLKSGGGGLFAQAAPEDGPFDPPAEPGDFGGDLPPPGAGLRGATPGAAVPEPGVWALMIMGFGLAGAALRRRRPAVVRVQPPQ